MIFMYSYLVALCSHTQYIFQSRLLIM
jgi:hypothetical protein